MIRYPGQTCCYLNGLLSGWETWQSSQKITSLSSLEVTKDGLGQKFSLGVDGNVGVDDGDDDDSGNDDNGNSNDPLWWAIAAFFILKNFIEFLTKYSN